MLICKRRSRHALLAFCLCAAAHISGQVQTQPAGVESAWDARRIIDSVSRNDEQLRPVLGAIDPKAWYEQKGAPSTYVIQWQTAQRQLNDLEITAKQVASKPDSLPGVLDLYFRLEALEESARAVDEGAKRYGDRQTADQLTRLVAGNFDARQRLRQYIQDLSADLEANYKIADSEAQRCRGMISREPLPSNKRKSN
jgi:hypothetical protein